MRIQPKTLVLAGVAALLLGINLVDRGSGERIAEQLPVLHAVDRDEVTRVEITSAAEKVVLKKEVETWKVVAPYEADADQVAVRTLLQNFRKDVGVDIRVDSGNLESYGLDTTNGIVVEVFTWAKTPEISFTVGNDAPGGSSFVRLSGEDAVYRARVGGRHRYDKPAADWRNRVILGFEKELAVALSVRQGESVGLRVARGASESLDEAGNPLPGPWALVPDPGWPTDSLAIDALAQSLGSMRAGDILGPEFDGGFTPALAEVEVVLDDGSTRVMEVGSRKIEGAAFVRVKGQDAVYRVARGTIDRLLAPVSDFRDLTVLSFSRTDVDTMAYEEGGTTILLQQDLASSLWTVIQPANVDVDIRLVFFAVNTLASLRAHELSTATDAEAGLDRARGRIVVQFLDGHTESLDLGQPATDSAGRPAVFARVGGSRQIFLLRDTQVEKLLQGFGRQ